MLALFVFLFGVAALVASPGKAGEGARFCTRKAQAPATEVDPQAAKEYLEKVVLKNSRRPYGFATGV